MFRRTSLTCRLKTRVTIIGFSVLLICCLLLYRALASMPATHPRRHHPLPTMEQKYSPRQHLKQKDTPHNSFQANVIDKNTHNNSKYANFNPEEFEKMNRKLLDDNSRKALLKFLHTLYPANWATASDTDDVALDLKYILVDYGLESKMSCKQIDSLTLDASMSHSGSSYLEYAYPSGGEPDRSSAHLRSRFNTKLDKLAYVLKSLSSDRETKIACMKQVYEASRCAAMGNYRLLREILFLSVLRHPNIIMMEGYCLRGNRVSVRMPEKGLIIVTEVGTRVTPSVISEMTWSKRIKVALQVGQLLLYLDNTPVGSLRFKKLSLQDFLLVQGQHLKLAELGQLELGDLPCTHNSQCGLAESADVQACSNGFCKGMNRIINFRTAAKEVLQQVLQNPPGPSEETLVSNLRINNLDLPQFLQELQVMSSKYESNASVVVVNPNSALVVGQEESHRVRVEKQDRAGEDHIHKSAKGVQVASSEAVLSNFVRYDHRNFAGIYDYLCAGSRVTWGCVHIVTSLLEAATLCLKDSMCRSFVTFSSQPESDNLMTVVLKNDTDSNPHISSGTTLFIHGSAMSSRRGGERQDVETKMQEEKKEVSISQPSTKLETCMDETLRSQEAARYAREKRLMTHLGFKGVREQTWRRSASRHHISGLGRLIKAQGSGGRFKVMFIAEDGPTESHLAYTLIYHLDRILGVYHTPPCVGKQLSTEDVDHYLSDGQWDEAFRLLIESDGTLSGILVVPKPKVIKNHQLNLEPLSSMTKDIVPFIRSQKLQLEYILVWWLGKIGYTVNDHQGYKGHLIHFYADKAFVKQDLDMSGYLNHCQFPSVVYKSLTCFQCSPEQETAGTQVVICSLGQEVVRRARAMFADDVELFVHNLRARELADVINSAATSAINIINTCIQTFGSEKVLY
ncbi:unnamed protein product [Candidula unifasciata]|uniref:FAM69 protein-kinase domain-containing protein n=1 Tax=Candidula unifasciata TaxID=100452 RepID=A0A8S4A0Z8_9EUPU|nr:unnamed protein product [Candidula unifasciata]